MEIGTATNLEIGPNVTRMHFARDCYNLTSLWQRALILHLFFLLSIYRKASNHSNHQRECTWHWKFIWILYFSKKNSLGI